MRSVGVADPSSKKNRNKTINTLMHFYASTDSGNVGFHLDVSIQISSKALSMKIHNIHSCDKQPFISLM